MFKRSIYAALLTGCVTVAGVTTAAAQTGPQPEQWGVIQTYCVGCHNSKTRSGGRDFESMSATQIAQNTETWEAAIRKLRGGLMANSDAHDADPLPQMLVGRGGGRVRGNQHLHYPQDAPHANMLVTILDRAGVPDTEFKNFADSTGPISEV